MSTGFLDSNFVITKINYLSMKLVIFRETDCIFTPNIFEFLREMMHFEIFENISKYCWIIGYEHELDRATIGSQQTN